MANQTDVKMPLLWILQEQIDISSVKVLQYTRKIRLVSFLGKAARILVA